MNARKLSKPQQHAVRLLEIQDDDRGWAAQSTLVSVGVHTRTLKSLAAQAMAEATVRTRKNRRTEEPCWRLTGRGEKAAAQLKAVPA